MLTLSYLLLAVPLFLAVALVAGNNLSACVGTLIGSGVVRRSTGIGIGVAGYVSGLILQGSQMSRVADMLFPTTSYTLISEALVATIVVFVFALWMRAPVSLSMSLVGLVLGISVSKNLPIDAGYALTVVAMWFVAPVASILSSALLVRLLVRSKPVDVWKRASTFKAALLAASFLASYVLGANTMGVVVAVAGFTLPDVLTAIAGIAAGSLLLSRGSIQKIGQQMFSLRYSNAFLTLMDSVVLVETATLFGLPLSNTQTIASSLFGAGIAYKQRFLSAKPFILIALGWVSASLVSFFIGLAV